MGVFLSVKNLLLKHVQAIEQNKKNFVNDPARDFTRTRKLSFSDTVMMVISMECGSVRSELLKYFSYSPDTASSSAFVQQRGKIKPDAFKALFQSFSAQLPSPTYREYHFFAVDGSDVQIPLEGPCDEYRYFRNGQQSDYFQLHLNAVYDLLGEHYCAAYTEPRKGHNERAAFHKLLEEQAFPDKSLFIFDRGYEGYPLMAHISSKNQFFVIRAKDNHTGGILKGLALPQEDEYDFSFNKICVDRWRLRYNNAPELYHRVHCSNTPYFINASVKEYPLAFRVVRFRLDNGSYECLLTNLPKEEFDLTALKDVYGMRWGIETSFRYLKHSVGLLYFHSKKIESIEQEIWARLILYNFCMAVTSDIGKKKKTARYLYKPNIANAIHVCRRFLKTLTDETPPNVEQLISGELSPVRAERNSPRKQPIIKPRKFNYRVY
ncbi:MAG: IS4 family transposase [Lachnospiraceae bacterium]|nr:IS4 family transposase [Lachnospiraceae bacterium]